MEKKRGMHVRARETAAWQSSEVQQCFFFSQNCTRIMEWQAKLVYYEHLEKGTEKHRTSSYWTVKIAFQHVSGVSSRFTRLSVDVDARANTDFCNATSKLVMNAPLHLQTRRQNHS